MSGKASQSAIILYGIRNCDTVRKARAWLDESGIEYAFHDYKTQGVARPRLEDWCRVLGWERLLNRAGTTFRKLPDAAKQSLNESRAIALMMEQPSLIKRPVIEKGGELLVGFEPEIYEKMLTSRH